VTFFIPLGQRVALSFNEQIPGWQVQVWSILTILSNWIYSPGLKTRFLPLLSETASERQTLPIHLGSSRMVKWLVWLHSWLQTHHLPGAASVVWLQGAETINPGQWWWWQTLWAKFMNGV
jgi:hypothetical protein